MSELNPEWIDRLASRDAQERAKAAAEIYRVGTRRAGAAVHAWWQNPELAQLCGAHPRATVGLAVQPLTFANIREANDWPRLAQVPPEQDASEFELHFPGGIKLDVLTTREPKGPGAIARYLAKQGEGIQQVEFPCENVDRAAALLREQFGVQPVYPARRPGADGTSVNFFLVAAPDDTRVLIELYEKPGSVPD
jgi:hypothetical protein